MTNRAMKDGLNSSILPHSRGASGGKGLPTRCHAIHKILFDAKMPLTQGEIERQLSSFGYNQKTIDVTTNHLRSLCNGLGSDNLIAAIRDNQGRYSLTPEARRKLASSPFSDKLSEISNPSPFNANDQSSCTANLDLLPVGQASVEETDNGNNTEVTGSETQTGAGFGNPGENKIVESAAIQAVVKTYRVDGWLVQSVERDRCGYDLICSKGEMVQNVEVKGVKGDALCFNITAGEVDQARNNPKFYLVVVTSALSPTFKITKYSGAEFCRRFTLNPIQYRAILRL